MIRIGILCPSEIAFRRFMPALQKTGNKIQFSGIAFSSPEEWFGDLSKISPAAIREQQESEKAKAQTFIDTYGHKLYPSYQQLIESSEIDAIYIPLPPALHFKWAEMALRHGKHVFVEKPSTTCLSDTETLVRLANTKGLALHENYMFAFHNQLKVLNEVVSRGEIGEVRLYRICFGFPIRSQNDFRYNKLLGGGALLDAGGYTIKLATLLLGTGANLTAATAGYKSTFDVDLYGAATMVNEHGAVAQLAFGMDNDYRCDLEIWGSKGTITTKRILTAPDGFTPNYIIKKNQEEEIHCLPPDDAFLKSIQKFTQCIFNDSEREENYEALILQGRLVEEYKKLSNLL